MTSCTSKLGSVSLLALAMACLQLSAAELEISPFASIPETRPSAGTPVTKSRSYLPEPGPWGALDCRVLTLEPPDRVLLGIAGSEAWWDETVWRFELEVEELERLLSDCGVDESAVAAFARDGSLRDLGDHVEFRPTESFIEGLTADQRRLIYPSIIGTVGDWNPYQSPLVLRPGGIREMEALIPSGLSSGTVDLVERLCYTRTGPSLIFSDIAHAMRLAKDDEERVRLLKTLGRQDSLRARLLVSEQTDLAALAGYWSGDGRNEGVLPLLESVAGTLGVDRLDIVHLLPPTPRKLLHVYPRPEMSVGMDMPDCFSTALSFFSDEPPPRFMDSVHQVVDERYERATRPWKLGDLLVLSDPNTGEIVHACNYIAADIVFTKNGTAATRPWVLVRLSEVMTEYLMGERLSGSFYRLKAGYRR